MRLALAAALATGLFCAVFAGALDLVTDALALWQVMIAGGVSGFLGSLFARLVLRRLK